MKIKNNKKSNKKFDKKFEKKNNKKTRKTRKMRGAGSKRNIEPLPNPPSHSNSGSYVIDILDEEPTTPPPPPPPPPPAESFPIDITTEKDGKTVTTPVAVVEPEFLFGKYYVGKKIGLGAFGKVFLSGVHGEPRNKVIIKVMETQTPETVESTQNEIRILKEIKDSCAQYVLCYIDDYKDTSKDLVYLVCEYLEGYVDMFDYFYNPAKEYKFGYHADLYEIQDSIIQQMCEGLQYMHNMGLAHRDIKLENILVRRNPPYLIKYIDFGFAYMENENYKSPNLNNVCGSLVTMDPILHYIEKKRVPFNLDTYQKSDIFSLGIVIFAVLTNGLTPGRLKNGGKQDETSEYLFNTNHPYKDQRNAITLYNLFYVKGALCRNYNKFVETIYLNLRMAKDYSKTDRIFGYFPDMVMKHKLQFPSDKLPDIDLTVLNPSKEEFDDMKSYDFILH